MPFSMGPGLCRFVGVISAAAERGEVQPTRFILYGSAASALVEHCARF
jgi:hypothetical protein